MEQEQLTPDLIWGRYAKGVSYNSSLGLYDTVKRNENFFIGKQWEGVQSNGLPTPVFNLIKRIVLFQVASTATDNLKVNVSPLNLSIMQPDEMEYVCEVIGAQFDSIMEDTKFGHLSRAYMKNGAVDGDAILYSWFDASAETGQDAKGAIKNELLDNTRVIFGNVTSRDVQKQPYIIVVRRELLKDVKEQAKADGNDPDIVQADEDDPDAPGESQDGMTTTITYMEKRDGIVRFAKSVKDGWVKKPWSTGMKRYPISYFSWERVKDSYHGQALTTELIPVQEWVNKAFAMVMIHIMTLAFGKVVYDKTKLDGGWDGRVGVAVGVMGDPSSIAKSIDPTPFSNQVLDVIELAINITKELCGATDAATGSSNMDNATAILALQKATQVPMELVRQDFHDAVEDTALNWLDIQRAYYGTRLVNVPLTEEDKQEYMMRGENPPETKTVTFDFGVLERLPLTLKLDVGGSAYWSEIAQLNTLDNLLTQGQISVTDYLERVPEGYISKKQDLIDAIQERMAPAPDAGLIGTDPNMDPLLMRGEQNLERMEMMM